jgi:hypothetical protein
MLKFAIPVLHVSSSLAAEQFFTRLGFHQEFAMRLDASKPDPCYMGLKRDDVLLHVSSFSGDGVSGGVVYVAVDNVDELHKELVAKGIPIDTGPINQDWGNREMYVKDGDRNCLRFTQELE